MGIFKKPEQSLEKFFMWNEFHYENHSQIGFENMERLITLPMGWDLPTSAQGRLRPTTNPEGLVQSRHFSLCYSIHSVSGPVERRLNPLCPKNTP